MQLVEAEKGESTGITATLRKMEISEKVALEVSEKDAPSARAIITYLHRTTDFKYTTQKTESGILVWRTA